MAGIARICKAYGGMVINGRRYLWDYAQDKAVLAEELVGQRLKDSERARLQPTLQGALGSARIRQRQKARRKPQKPEQPDLLPPSSPEPRSEEEVEAWMAELPF